MRLIPVLGLALALAGCGDNSTPPGDEANPGGGTPTGQTGRDPSESNGTTDSEPPDDGSGPVLPPLPGSNAAEPNGSARAPGGNGQAQVRILDWQQTLDLVNQHAGKVVVLDIWSHDCAPCLRELPHFVALSKSHPGRVTCIGFNVDYTGSKKEPPESFRDAVEATLARHDAEFVNVICSEPSIPFFDSIKLGGPPAVYVFDQQGNQVRRFDNENKGAEFDYATDVVPLVEQLLAGTSGE